MYNIALEVEKNLIRTELEGFWSEHDFDAFIADEKSALAKLRCPPGKHILLCDLTKLSVVSQDVSSHIAKELNSNGPRDAFWIAIAIGSALLKMQIQRLIVRPNVMIFDDTQAAEKWLLSVSGYGNP